MCLFVLIVNFAPWDELNISLRSNDEFTQVSFKLILNEIVSFKINRYFIQEASPYDSELEGKPGYLIMLLLEICTRIFRLDTNSVIMANIVKTLRCGYFLNFIFNK